jgi:hypothetical protein
MVVVLLQEETREWELLLRRKASHEQHQQPCELTETLDSHR